MESNYLVKVGIVSHIHEEHGQVDNIVQVSVHLVKNVLHARDQ